MNSHFDIQKLLSAYDGDDLSEKDRTLVEEHLKGCRECRAELADIEITMKLLRTTPEVEPPPWMTARIMAHVRDQARESVPWYRRLLLPLRIRVPLQALTLLLVSVTGYYLSKSVETEMKGSVITEDAPVSQSPRNINRLQKAEQPSVPARKSAVPTLPAGAEKRERLAASAERSDAINSGADRKEEPVYKDSPPAVQAPPPAHAPVISPSSVESARPAPAGGSPAEPAMKASSAEKSFIGSGEATFEVKKKAAKGMLRKESEAIAPSPVSRGAADSAVKILPQLFLRLTVPDPSSANREISAASIRSGAKIIEETSSVPNRIRIRIPAAKMSELLEQLDRIGRLSERPKLKSTAEELEVTVEW